MQSYDAMKHSVATKPPSTNLVPVEEYKIGTKFIIQIYILYILNYQS